MVDWIQNLMDSLGYLGIVLLMVLENVFPPIPSELILPSAGFAASRGDLSFVGVVLAGTLGSVVGTLPLYFIGRVFSEERVVAWADKHGKWLALSGDDIRKADDWFDRHGPKAVLFGRMVPGIRSLLSLPAGMSGMPLPTFLLYSAIGSALWASVLTGAGYLLGDHYDKVGEYIGPASTVIVVGLVVAAAVWILGRRHRAATQREDRNSGQN
ncbi:DedA family protein [Deinococcus humi]|uniref:Membrane protein DedA with SNARE-associated domain n=1 Tax=Deinococcus humi TaxID=662880 RepID=A0A7W8NGU8_9DEIO|nr:DedA family protein [Deinococcus humi]MBB5363317.1 membrane protein DedA with SNARE-associated domain [Deinococcus humi]GGO27139.1 alkaline phosphatase [Deinococcus humi]